MFPICSQLYLSYYQNVVGDPAAICFGGGGVALICRLKKK